MLFDCNLFEINISYRFGDIKAINLLCQQLATWLIITLNKDFISLFGQVLDPSIVSISPELVVCLMCRSCLRVWTYLSVLLSVQSML